MHIGNIMTWIQFKSKFFDHICFSTHEVYAWSPGFDRNNFVRWVQKGYILRLRKGLYSFPEYLNKPGISQFLAGKIYRPSYISLHSALSAYGVIPETVVQITSVTSLKTADFTNRFGEYSYKSIKQALMFGYYKREIRDGPAADFAFVEKALLDLLYLYPFYNTEKDIFDLRLKGDILSSDFDRGRWELYISRFQSKALEKRVRLLEKVYDL
jgi:predicted transcriptional regulator of viral defense system